MRAMEFVSEALTPSQYRSMVKGWDRTRLEKIFQQWPGKKNRNATRLYMELPISQSAVQVDSQVSNKLTQLGYDIVDYRRGLARKKTGNRNPTGIGKILSRAARTGDTEAAKALQTFQIDPTRTSSQSEHIGVISRHPYDIAGMSTDRGWTSCMNLVGGVECRYVPKDIRAGTLVAYLIKKDDVNINKPVGRLLLKPYINKKNQTAYALHEEEYGSVTLEFRKEVVKFATWLNRQQGVDGIFKMHPNLYGYDRIDPDKIAVLPPNISDPKLLQLVKKDSVYLKAALSSGIEPKEDVMIAAATKDGYVIEDIIKFGIRPSDDVMLAAVTNNGDALFYILDAGILPSDDMIEKVMLAAVTSYPLSLDYILDAYKINPEIKPSEDVLLAAASGNGYVIKNILKAGIEPSERVMLAAVKSHGPTIEHILRAGIRPSPKVRAAARKNGWRGS